MSTADAIATTEPTVIGEARDYDELVVALRALADRRNVSLMTLDEISGLHSGYCAKLLTIPPIRGLGRVSLGPLLKTLCGKLVIMEDSEALSKLGPRLVKRRPKGPKRGYKHKHQSAAAGASVPAPTLITPPQVPSVTPTSKPMTPAAAERFLAEAQVLAEGQQQAAASVS